MKFFTIGVYGSTEQEFFHKLINYKVDMFCDIRQRRGVRGAQYAFVNSKRLQQKLMTLNIKYEHYIELAPTKAIRALQQKADTCEGITKRNRAELGNVFKEAYQNTILNNFDFAVFLNQIEEKAAKNIVLFCVEEQPEACHRLIVSNVLEKLGYKVEHI